MRERLANRLLRGGDLRGALRLRREAVERAVELRGVSLALTGANLGLVLLTAGFARASVSHESQERR